MQILQEAYPETFNFEEFNSIRSFAKKLRYANNTLKKISSGSARVVYQVDNEKVLKIAKNSKGLAQNNIEADWGASMYGITAKVFDIGEFANGIGPFWVEMELAKKVTPNRFKNLSGFTIDEVHAYLSVIKSENTPKSFYYAPKIDPEIKQEMQESEIIQDLMSFIIDFGMSYPGDFGRVSTWGEVLRDGIPSLVLIDFGLTENVFNDFYKRR